MIVIIDNESEPRQQLLNAFLEMNVKDVVLAETYKDGIRVLREAHKDNTVPIIISDYDLGESMGTGRQLCQQLFFPELERATGGHAWHVLYSQHSTATLAEFVDSTQTDAILTRRKNDIAWVDSLLDYVRPLLDKKLASDDYELSPALPDIPVKDRIFIFNNRDSAHILNRRRDSLQDFLRIAVIPTQVQNDPEFKEQGALLFRGRFIPFPKQWARLLLRWRAASMKFRADLIKKPRSYVVGREDNEENKKTKNYEQLPPKNCENIANEIRGMEVLQLIASHLGCNKDEPHAKNKKHIIPPIKRRANFPCLPEFQTEEIKDGFVTRIQFVLDDRELDNFEEWRAKWLV